MKYFPSNGVFLLNLHGNRISTWERLSPSEDKKNGHLIFWRKVNNNWRKYKFTSSNFWFHFVPHSFKESSKIRLLPIFHSRRTNIDRYSSSPISMLVSTWKRRRKSQVYQCLHLYRGNLPHSYVRIVARFRFTNRSPDIENTSLKSDGFSNWKKEIQNGYRLIKCVQKINILG